MKIKSTQLRIGNLVITETSKKINRVICLDNYIKLNEDIKSHKEVLGIELTHEILIKCGFDLIGNSYFLKSIPFLYFFRPYVQAKYLLVKSNSGDKITSVKYLHELQNFCYCVLGEELDFNI